MTRGHTYTDEVLERLKSPDIKMGELLEIKSVAGENWRIYNGKEPITAQILTEKASGDVGGFPATPTTMNFPALDEAYVTGAFKGLFYSEALPGYVGKKMFLYGGTTKGSSYWDYHFNLIDMDTIATPVYSFKAQSGISNSSYEIVEILGTFYADYFKYVMVAYQIVYSGVKRFGYHWMKITDGTSNGVCVTSDVTPHPNAVFSLYQAPNDITSLYMAAYDVDNKKLYLRKYLSFNTAMSSSSTFAKDLHDFTKYDRTYDLELLADSKPVLFWDSANSKIMVQWQIADGTTYIGDFADPITTQVQLGNTTNTLKNTSMYTSQEGKSSLLMLGGKPYDFSKVGLPTGVTALPNNIEWMGGRNCTSGKLRLWFFNQSDSKYYNMSYNATLNKIEYISNVGFSDAGPEMKDTYPGISNNHIRRMTKPVFLGSKDGKELWVFNMRLAIYRYETNQTSFHRVYSVLVCIDSSNGNILWSWGNEGNIHYKHGDFDWDVLAFNTWGLTDMREDPTAPSTVPSPLGGTGTFSFVVRGSQEIEEIKDKILFFFHDMGNYFSGLYSKRPLAYGFCWKNFDDVIACTSKADLLTLLSTGGMPIFSTTIDNVPSIKESSNVSYPSVVWDCPFIRTSTGDIHLDYFTQGYSIKWNVFHFNIQLTNLNSSSLLFEYFDTYITSDGNLPQSIMGFTKNPSGLLNGFFDFGNTQFPFDKVLMYAGTHPYMYQGVLSERLQSDTFWSYKLNRYTYTDNNKNKSTILVYKSHICTTSDLMYVVCYLTSYSVNSTSYPTKRYCRVTKYYHNGVDWQTSQTFHFSLEGFSSFLKLTETGPGETMVAVNVTDFTALYFCVAQDNSLYVLKTGVPDGTLKSAIGCDLQSPTTFYSQPLNMTVLPLASYPTPQGIMLIDYKGTVSKVLIDIVGDTYQEYTFTPYPFEREAIKEDKDNLSRTLKIGIPETTGNHLLTLINSGEELRTKEINLYRVFLDDNGDPVGPAVTLFSGHIESWEYEADRKVATLKLSHAVFNFEQACPRNNFSMRCRHRFKGVRCGYSGAETYCDKSLTRCQTLGNEAHFGGFPWVAMRQRRVLWR